MAIVQSRCTLIEQKVTVRDAGDIRVVAHEHREEFVPEGTGQLGTVTMSDRALPVTRRERGNESVFTANGLDLPMQTELRVVATEGQHRQLSCSSGSQTLRVGEQTLRLGSNGDLSEESLQALRQARSGAAAIPLEFVCESHRFIPVRRVTPIGVGEQFSLDSFNRLTLSTDARQLVEIRRVSHMPRLMAALATFTTGVVAVVSATVWASGDEGADTGRVATFVAVPLFAISLGVTIADPTSDTVLDR
jgi:hypothetical protein